MPDENWEGIDGDEAKEIEFLNYQSQANVLEGLIRFNLYKAAKGSNHHPIPDQRALLELHHAGTLFLLNNPGQYRTGPVDLKSPNGTVLYTPPPHTEVPRYMGEFFDTLETYWSSSEKNAYEIAAYALWRINWIHPFINGNGRSARTFSYACLCLKMGVLLPGKMPITRQMLEIPEYYRTYVQALRVADQQPEDPDLRVMTALLERLLDTQMQSSYWSDEYMDQWIEKHNKTS